jgi:hypothetical protein
MVTVGSGTTPHPRKGNSTILLEQDLVNTILPHLHKISTVLEQDIVNTILPHLQNMKKSQMRFQNTISDGFPSPPFSYLESS